MIPATTPTRQIQQAVFEVLSQDGTLMDMLVGQGVYDEVDENAPYPYVVVGEAWETPDNTHSGYGRQTVISIHVWSEAPGTREMLVIGERIMQLLDHQPLEVEGHHVPGVIYEFSQTLRDPSPSKLRHLIQRYRIFTEQEM